MGRGVLEPVPPVATQGRLHSCSLWSPPTMRWADAYKPWDVLEVMVCDLQGWVIKDTVAPAWPLLNS